MVIVIELLLAAVALIGFWWWRIKMVGEVADKAVDLAQTAMNAPRKWRFKREAGGDPIRQIEDPRLGAVVLMYVTALSDGAISETEMKTIHFQARRAFCDNDEEADDLLTYAKWMAGRLHIDAITVRKLVKRIHTLAPDAGTELAEMVATVAEGQEKDPFVAQVSSAVGDVFGV